MGKLGEVDRGPVLVTRGRNLLPRSMSFRKILVPIDFSKGSMVGLAYAKAFETQFKSKLVLLHSVPFQYYFAGDDYARYDLPQIRRYAEKATREQMRNLVRKTAWNGLKVEISLQAGDARQQICERAKDADVDLIITSTHGTTGLRHVLLGSTAEYVVRHAHCPVLVVPSPLSETQTKSPKKK